MRPHGGPDGRLMGDRERWAAFPLSACFLGQHSGIQPTNGAAHYPNFYDLLHIPAQSQSAPQVFSRVPMEADFETEWSGQKYTIGPPKGKAWNILVFLDAASIWLLEALGCLRGLNGRLIECRLCRFPCFLRIDAPAQPPG